MPSQDGSGAQEVVRQSVFERKIAMSYTCWKCFHDFISTAALEVANTGTDEETSRSVASWQWSVNSWETMRASINEPTSFPSVAPVEVPAKASLACSNLLRSEMLSTLLFILCLQVRSVSGLGGCVVPYPLSREPACYIRLGASAVF